MSYCTHRYTKEIPDLIYRPVWAMGLKLGVFGFLPTTHTKTNAKQMRPWSWGTVKHFTRAYLHVQTAVHMHLMNHSNFECRKNLNTPNFSPCRDKNGTGSGIFLVCDCTSESAQTAQIYVAVYLPCDNSNHAWYRFMWKMQYMQKEIVCWAWKQNNPEVQ